MRSVQTIGRIDFDPIQLVVCWDMNTVLLNDKQSPREMVMCVVNALATFGAVQGAVCAGKGDMQRLGNSKSLFSFVVDADDVTGTACDPYGWQTAKERAQAVMKESGLQTKDVLYVGVTGSRVGLQSLLDTDMAAVSFTQSPYTQATAAQSKEDRLRAIEEREEGIYAQITALWGKAMRDRLAMRRHVEKQNKFLLGCCS